VVVVVVGVGVLVPLLPPCRVTRPSLPKGVLLWALVSPAHTHKGGPLVCSVPARSLVRRTGVVPARCCCSFVQLTHTLPTLVAEC
jgi:hypothetical protein